MHINRFLPMIIVCVCALALGDEKKSVEAPPVLSPEQKEAIAWAIVDAEVAVKYRDDLIANSCGKPGWVARRMREGLVCVLAK